MKTSSAKNKGRRLAVKVKELLYKYALDLRPGDIEVTSMGAPGEDLKLSPIAREKYPLTIECKNQERLNIWDAIKQSHEHEKTHTKNSPQQAFPCVCFSKNHEDVYIAMRLEDFLKLVA